ncbi:MAG: asparagine synthase (glutamine-hydrolyzing) [Rhodospirillaceae bacterium]
MCGIAALFAYHTDAPPVALAELLAVNQAMLRRGPDGGGHWIADDSRVGLGHRRLAIIDPDPRANQPMAIEDRYRITYNGEIYNYRALRNELAGQGVRFVTGSDTEVLLRLYERDGAAMVERLRGMFALIIWDAAERRLFLARDPFGIKALLAGGRAGKAGPDPAGHAGFFLLGSVPEPHTLYADIKALPAGHTLTVTADGRRDQRCYFDVRARLAEAGREPTPDLRALLLDSVRHHFVSDVPVGIFLSAGLDSATLTGLAAESELGDLRTFTLGFEEFVGTPRDEVPLAELVAKRYGTQQRTERVARLHFDGALPDILAAMDQPTIDGVNTYFVARVAAHGGLKVALSGLGGDELFGGYDSFRQVPALARALGWIPGLGLAGRAFRKAAMGFLGPIGSPKHMSLFEFGGSTGGAYFLRRGLFMPWELPDVMDPDLAAEGWKTLAPVVCLNDGVAGIRNPQNRIRALEMTWYMRNQLLRDADWAGMAHSLEIRVPLVDAMLFTALTPTLGVGPGPDKAAMAATPIPSLPCELLNRPKTGFFVPVERWLQQAGGGVNDTREPGLRGWAKRVYAAQTAGL